MLKCELRWEIIDERRSGLMSKMVSRVGSRWINCEGLMVENAMCMYESE